LRRSLEYYFEGCGGRSTPAVLVFGTSLDKDIAGIVAELHTFFDHIIVTRSRHPRSLEVASIVTELGKYGAQAQTAETVSDALSLARQKAGEQGFICVTGSLFIVGEALECLGRPV
jgi:dihydrofolate synthase/folylpolyglutamate synthase